MKHSTLTLFLLLFCLNLFAQQRRVQLTGTVLDLRTSAPLAGATVWIEDARLGTQTDLEGKFSLSNIPTGHHLVEISHTGYGTRVEHVDVRANQELTVSLSQVVLENQGVTVTGVSNATSIRKSPIPVTSIRRAELLQIPSTNIADALARQPGVSQVTTGPAISKPVIRGLGSNRVVVINDGVRQEGQQWGEEHGLELDEASVQRAEILKGPASLIYGSDALAGVINLITNSPVPQGTMRGNILTQYQTNSRLFGPHANFAGNRGGFSWNLYGSLRSAGDYQNRYDGRVLNSRFRERNAGGYIGLNKGWGYSHLIFSHFNQKIGMIEGDRDSATGAFLLYAESPLEKIASGDELRSRRLLVPFQHILHRKLVWDNNFNLGGSRLRLNAALQSNRRREYGDPERPDEAELYFDLSTGTYNLHWILPEMQQWRTTIGFNGMTQQNRNRAEEVIIPEYRFQDAGLFVFTQGLFDRTTLSGGLRYDNRSVHSKALMQGGDLKFTAFRKHFSNLSGSAGISFEPNETWVLKANVARGFRAPNMAELASNGAHEGTNRYEYGAQDLRSEKSLQVDGTVEVNRQHFNLGINAFYNSVRDFIYYRKLENGAGEDSLVELDGEELTAFRFEQDNARLSGFEVVFDLHPHPLDWLHFENKLSFVRGRFRTAVDGTDNLPLIPAPRWNSELRANFPKWGRGLQNVYLRIEAENNLRQNHPFTAYGTETATPAYTLLHAGLGADISRKERTLFSLHLAATNLTDVAWQHHLSRLKYTDPNERTGRPGVYNMGRNFSVKLNIPFSFTGN